MTGRTNDIVSSNSPTTGSFLDKKKWQRKQSKDWTADIAAEHLHGSLADYLRSHADPAQQSTLKAELIDFLLDQGNEHGIDDCVRWCLLSITVDPENRGPESTTIREELIGKQPYLAFLPNVEGVIPGKFPHKDIGQRTCFFKWTCNNIDSHFKRGRSSSLWRKFGFSERNGDLTPSPFFDALYYGYHDIVKHMITSMETFLNTKLVNSSDPGSFKPNDVLQRILGTNIPNLGTALERTAYGARTNDVAPSYMPTSDHVAAGQEANRTSVAETLAPNHLGIIRDMLTRDPNLIIRDTKFGTERGPANPRQDKTFTIALDERQWEIVDTILQLAPEGFSQDTGAIDQVVRRFPTGTELLQQTSSLNMLLNMWYKNPSLNEGVTNKIISIDHGPFWKRERVAAKLRTLVANDSTARDLLERGLLLKSESFVQEIFSISPEIFDIKVAEHIVQKQDSVAWKMKPVTQAWAAYLRKAEAVGEQDPRQFLLPLAVQAGKTAIVEEFVSNKPSLACEQSTAPTGFKWSTDEKEVGLFPLWHNNCKLERGQDGREGRWLPRRDKAERLEIRNLLVKACITATENMQEMCRIFEYSHERVADLCFELSRFNTTSFPLDSLAKSLPRLIEPSATNQAYHRYEPVLRYADFPNLDCRGDDGRQSREFQVHSEVFQILEWLHKYNGVREIVRLRVPDRIYSSHDEHEIANQVARFKVRNLDWRCLDLAISVFDDLDELNLETLHLYSSGKRAVISHWLSKDSGILRLRSLRDVKFHLVKECISDMSLAKLATALRDGLEALKETRDKELKVNDSAPGFIYSVDIESWNTQPSRNKTSLDNVAERAVPSLWPFIRGYRNYVDNEKRKDGTFEFRPTRIAIIDNGIMNIDPIIDEAPILSPSVSSALNTTSTTDISVSHGQDAASQSEPSDEAQAKAKPLRKSESVSNRVVDGRSFLDENDTMGPWSFASDPHGTQMANIICAIDPQCEVYVAKIIEGRYGIVPNRLARAIQCATKHWKVDIISMSLASSEKDIRVTQAVEAAEEQGILLLCSSHDEGLNVAEAYPATMKETITFAASNRIGEISQGMNNNAYDFRIAATNVFAGFVPFMQFDDTVSGSSVATAIGAGLSSLIISCHHLANDNRRRRERKWKKEKVEKWLKSMLSSSESESKYIRLEMFGGLDKLPDSRRKNPDVEEMLECFRDELKELEDY